MWKKGTCIIISALGNGVLRALLGFLEKNYWIILCFIVLCPTSKGGNLGKWNKMELRLCCWIVTFMSRWLLREDQEWSHPLRSKVFCCDVRVCYKIKCSQNHVTSQFFAPLWVQMCGACICYNNYFIGTQFNDYNYIYLWKKKKSKQYKHFKWGTFKFDPLKCNNTQRVCIWTHNFRISHWWNHLLVFALHKCHEKLKIRVSKPFSRWYESIGTLL